MSIFTLTPTNKLSYWVFQGPPRPPFTPTDLRKARENIERHRHALEDCMAHGGDLSQVAEPLRSLAPEMDRILAALNLIRDLQEVNVSADFWWHLVMWARFVLALVMLVMAGWGWRLDKSIPLCAVLINCKYLFPTNDGLEYVTTQLKTLGRGFFFEHFLNTCLLLIYCLRKGPVVIGLTAVYCVFFLIGCRVSRVKFDNLWKVSGCTLPRSDEKAA